MQQDLPRLANALLVIMGYRRSSRPKLQVFVLYCMSVSVLVVYSLSVYAAFAWFAQTELENATKRSGFFTSMTVVMLDLEVRVLWAGLPPVHRCRG